MYLFFFVDGHRPHPFGNANMLPPQSLCQVSCGQPPSTLLWYYTYVLCKVILFSFLWTFTLRNLLPTVDVPRPRQCSYQEKYTTAISFKVAKALKNKLDSFSIYDSWESFCGDEVDFLHNDVQKKSQIILSNINTLATLVESLTGQCPKLLGILIMELTKLCVVSSGFTCSLD